MSDEPICCAGCVVVAESGTGLLLLLIRDKQGVWTLPKGHLDPGETEEQAAIREVAEETGIACRIRRLVGRVTYPVYRQGVWRDKQVAYFLAGAQPHEPIPALAEGISAAQWMPLRSGIARIAYPQVREMARRATYGLE
jgi:8-oxo-dGTP diphosphatase